MDRSYILGLKRHIDDKTTRFYDVEEFRGIVIYFTCYMMDGWRESLELYASTLGMQNGEMVITGKTLNNVKQWWYNDWDLHTIFIQV